MDARVLRDRGRVKSFYLNSGAEFDLCAKLMLSGDHDSDTDGWVVVASCASLPTWEWERAGEIRQDAGEGGRRALLAGMAIHCISRTDSHKISLFRGRPSLSIPRLIAFFHCPIPSDVGIFPLCHFAEGMEGIQFDGVSERARERRRYRAHFIRAAAAFPFAFRQAGSLGACSSDVCIEYIPKVQK